MISPRLDAVLKAKLESTAGVDAHGPLDRLRHTREVCTATIRR